MPRAKKSIPDPEFAPAPAPAPAPPAAEKRTTKKKEKEKKEEKKEPSWSDLYYLLAEVSERLLKSLTRREDLPPDVADLLQGILALREAKDLFYAEKERLSPFSALFWAEELQKWATKNMEMPDGVHVRRAMMEVDTDEIPFAED
jgi:hypothetical protein